MVVRGAIKATTKRWFIIMLLAHTLRDPNFGDKFRMKWITSNTIDYLLCTHYYTSFQYLKFNGKELLDTTSDMNQTKLSSAGIGDINVDAFSANESGIFSIRSKSSMDGNHKSFYMKSCDRIKRVMDRREGGLV